MILRSNSAILLYEKVNDDEKEEKGNNLNNIRIHSEDAIRVKVSRVCFTSLVIMYLLNII